MNLATSLCTAALVLAAAPAHAVAPIADSPLFLTVAVPPNVTVTIDDSGSMARAFVPDTCGASANDCATLDNRYTKSAYANPLYYNPRVRYPAPKNAAGADLPTAFTAAHRNGFDPAGGLGAINLSNSYRPSAFLNLPPGGTATEAYMDHFDGDVRCARTTPRMCQISNGTGGWISTGTACSGTTDTARDTSCRNTDSFPAPAYYYIYDGANSGCSGTIAQRRVLNACYDLKIVSATSGTTDFNGDGVVDASEADERQNFANWYSFARTRNLATQAAASLAFSTLGEEVRVAWQALHTCRNSATNFVDADCDGWKNNFAGISNAIRPFTGTHKANFYSWLSQIPTNSSTPLPAAMQRVGEYYRTSGENSPYDTDFTTPSSGELACRRNYHVLMTDGIWNNAITVPGGNRDGSSVAFPEAVDGVTTYDARTPFGDAHTNTLADLAFHYWVSDLRGSLENNLQKNYRDTTGVTNADNFWNPRNDPATWQHMVNFTIGLGLTDYLRQEGLTWTGNMFGGSYAGLAAGTTLWPQPASDDPANVADLWHAAINSRGQFFSADDPASLSVAFRSALTAITDAAGSAAALSANSTTLTGSTVVYQARFADDWSGTLLALPVDANGQASTTPAWDAAEVLPAHGSRRIFTYNGSGGVPFTTCSNLSADQKAALDRNSGGVTDNLCTERLGWLRGDPTHEVRSTITGSLKMFRNRPETVMGDIINSDPAYAKDTDYGYSGLPAGTPGQSSYDAYRAANGTRMAMVYVGSNDGRVYGIRGDTGAATSGVEQFSYIPGAVYENLTHLTDPSYAHRYYVDGSIIVRDAYIGGSWKTILVGGLNAGGKAVYALDVTTPGTFNSSNVLWEFDLTDDANDLGLTYSRPQIGVLENGDWVAIFGNGYNSAGGGAHLFIVDLATGALIQKITASDESGDETNGLSTPFLHDADDDKMIDAVYAGDLHGNLWKFDVSGASTSWGVANGAPLFRAAIGATRQPITAQPKLAPHPDGGHIVLFGTGRYLANGDVFDTSRQTFYGVWDDGAWTDTATRADLQAQWFEAQGSAESGAEVRQVTNNSVDWVGGERGWYLDLLEGSGVSAPEIGERVVHTSIVVHDAVVFNSIIPSTNPCTPGGTSWLYGLRFDTGGRFNHSTFDTNDDDRFDARDAPTEGGTNSVVRTGELGITNVPVAIDDSEDTLKVLLLQTGSSGGTETSEACLVMGGCATLAPGVVRRSWIQIR